MAPGQVSLKLCHRASLQSWNYSSGINYFGEKLAYGLGITSPDWQYAIDIHEDLEREKREEQQAEEKALRGQREEAAKILKEMEAAPERTANPHNL